MSYSPLIVYSVLTKDIRWNELAVQRVLEEFDLAKEYPAAVA